MKENRSANKQRARQSNLSLASPSKTRITFRKNEPAYVQISKRGVSLSVVKFIEKSPYDPRNSWTWKNSSITDWDHYADAATPTPPSSSTLPEPPQLWRNKRRPLATSTLKHSQLSSLLPGAPIFLDGNDESVVSEGFDEVEDYVAKLEYVSKMINDDSGFSQSEASFVTCFDDASSEATSQDFNSAESDFEVAIESKYQVDEGVSSSFTRDESTDKTVIDEDPAILGYTKMQSFKKIEDSLCELLNIS